MLQLLHLLYPPCILTIPPRRHLHQSAGWNKVFSCISKYVLAFSFSISFSFFNFSRCYVSRKSRFYTQQCKLLINFTGTKRQNNINDERQKIKATLIGSCGDSHTSLGVCLLLCSAKKTCHELPARTLLATIETIEKRVRLTLSGAGVIDRDDISAGSAGPGVWLATFVTAKDSKKASAI